MIDKLIFIRNKQGFIKYFKNTSWLLIEKILRMTLGLFIGVWVARHLGPAQFGLFSYVSSIVALFSAIAMMGLDSIVIKEIVKNKNNLNSIMGTAIILKLIGVGIVFCCISIAIQFTNNDYNTNLLIYIVALGLFFQTFNVIEFYFHSQTLSKFILYVNSLSLFISSILKVIFISLNYDLIYFVWITVIDFIVLALGYLYFFQSKDRSIKNWKWDNKLAKCFLNESWPLILSSLSFVIYNNIDKIMLKNMLDNYSVGVYSAATRLVLPWQFIPGLIVSSLMPALVRSYENSIEQFHLRIKKLSSLLIWVALILSILYSLFSDLLIDITFGEKYNESSLVMVYLIWANVFIFFNSVWNRWMLIKGNTKITFYFSLTTGLINILLNYFLILEYGIIGASISLLLSLSCSYLIFYVILDNSIIKIFLSSLFFIYKMKSK
jgi:O-antigen/teichoic acid export membrane protein